MTVILLASYGRPEGLKNVMSQIYRIARPDIKLFLNCEPIGFWRSLNKELVLIDNFEPFIWLADDVSLGEDWFDRAVDCWKKNFQDGLGLIVLNDLNVLDATAAFGMTTKAWLYVLFGETNFPNKFNHNYLDTLISDRSKQLNRFHFCKEAIVEHMHWSIGKRQRDDTDLRIHLSKKDDKQLKDQMDVEWLNGENKEAIKRMEEWQRRSKN